MSEELSIEERFGNVLSAEMPTEDNSDSVEPEQPEPEEAIEAEGEELEAVEEESTEELEVEDDEETPADSEYIEFLDDEGKPVRVTPEEYRNGYLRQADFTRKSQRNAEKNRQLDEAVEKLSKERQELEQYFTQKIEELSMFEETPPDFDELYESDPLGAPKIEREWNKRQEKKRELFAEHQKMQEQQLQKYQEEMRQKSIREQEKLPTLIPEFQNKETRQKGLQELVSHLQEEGFTDQEIFSVTDARHFKLLWYGYQYQKNMKGASQIARKKSAGKPRVLKPGSARPKPSKESRVAKKIDAARSSQSKEAWTNVFQDVLDNR